MNTIRILGYFVKMSAAYGRGQNVIEWLIMDIRLPLISVFTPYIHITKYLSLIWRQFFSGLPLV